MKVLLPIAAGLLTMAPMVNSFGVVSPNRIASASSSALFAMLPEEERSPAQKEIAAIQARWNEVRHMSKEEVDALDDATDGEYKLAYARFFERYHADMTKMEEIAEKLQTMLDPPRIQKKTNGQRKRDKWAKVQAREAAREAERVGAAK